MSTAINVNDLISLEKLDLDDNNLTSIDQFTFKGLVKWTELDLMHNNISNYDPDLFHGLHATINL